MAVSDAWVASRITYTETVLAVARGRPHEDADRLDDDWPEFVVIEIDQTLVEAAADLGAAENLRTLDSLHLASALSLGPPLTLATWDRALHAAAKRRGLDVLPE